MRIQKKWIGYLQTLWNLGVSGCGGQLFGFAYLSLGQNWRKDQSVELVAGLGSIRQGVYFYEDAGNKE